MNILIKDISHFKKTRSQFSSIALYQVHEQNNDIIKGVGGATHLLNRPDICINVFLI